MNDKRIYLSLAQESGFEQEYIHDALKSNWITSGGSNVDQFESKLQNYFGCENFIVALNLGTSAIHLSLILLGIKADDEVKLSNHDFFCISKSNFISRRNSDIC